MQVFVPEVISVLSTFANNQFEEHLNSIPFVKSIIGKPNEDLVFRYDEHGSREANIVKAIEASDINAIVRLNVAARESLARRICALDAVKSLDGTQLKAFTAALAQNVHCTQGPPGTGKVFI